MAGVVSGPCSRTNVDCNADRKQLIAPCRWPHDCRSCPLRLGHPDNFPLGEDFLGDENELRSNVALCWAFLCDCAGAYGTAAEELRHSECSAKRRNRTTAGSTRTSKKGAGCACA